MDERRHLARDNFRASCLIQLGDGESLHGTTRNISQDGVFVDCMLTPRVQARGLRLGEFGLFVLRYRLGSGDAALRLRAQIVHMLPGGLGLSIQFGELTKADQRVLARIIETGETDLGNFAV